MDITDHEINKFISIFHTLLKTSLNKDKFLERLAVDTEDGVQDTILLIVTKLIKLLKGNIDSLNLKKKIRSGLKKIKSILFLTSKVDGKDKDGSEEGSRPDRGDDRCNNQDCREQLHVEEEHLEPALKTLKVGFVTKLSKLKN